MTSIVFKEDIENIISDYGIPWKKMSGAVVLVTGATGLIGSALVHAFVAASTRYELGLTIIGNGRNVAKSKKLLEYGMNLFIASDIREPFPKEIVSSTVDYIFHCAAITRSADMVAKPVDIMITAIDGTRSILELARSRHCKSFVYLSSMEVYGQTDLSEVKEASLGYLDLSNPRTSYPESKRLCETLCIAYNKQYGVPVKIARLSQTFGAGVPKDDTRVFAQFARSAIAGDDIVLYTEGNSRGNYCYISDTVRALLLLSLKGENAQAYNVSNPYTSMTIRDMAELVAEEICSGKIKVRTEIPPDANKLGYAPECGYILNVEKTKNLGWQPKYYLADMYRRLIADWKNNGDVSV